MKAEKLTSKILDTLDPERILYAEFAEGGAMGAAGTARLYVLDGNDLHFYLVNLGEKSSEADIHAYADAYTYLHKLQDAKILSYAYAGYGNHAWKHKDITFARDDDNKIFIYTIGKDIFSITPSADGVYLNVASHFAAPQIDLKALAKLRKKVLKHSTKDELAFFDAYTEQIERINSGHGNYNITVDDYWCAIIYIRSLNLEDFNLSDDQINIGIRAIGKYRLRLLVAEYGWSTINQFMINLLDTQSTDVFFEFNKYINSLSAAQKDENHTPFNINNLLSTINYFSSRCTSLDRYDKNNILHLFDFPVIIKFTEAAHQEILNSILKLSPAELLRSADSISYYIANFIFNEDTLSYADILPACTHIIETLPATDYNDTHPDYLFWLAAEVIDRIWRYVSENKITQKKCRDLIYELFSPRVGGIWPLVHYDEFEFKSQIATSIFEESVGFLMSLDDIASRSDQLKSYLNLYREGYQYPLPSITRRAFFDTLKDYESSKDQFECILTTHNVEEYSRLLAHPSTVKEATHVLEELFRTDNEARITGIHRIATFEQLLLNGNSIGVGVHILNYLTKNFDAFSNIITTDSEAEKLDPLEVITSLYTAAAAGATEENELPPLKALAKKIAKYVKDLQIDQTMNAGSLKGKDIRTSKIDVDSITEAALRYAKKHRRTILFQRSALQKFF